MPGAGPQFDAVRYGWRRRRRRLSKAVFVSYGVFDCNSAGHVAGFANQLARHGFRVAVCGAGSVTKAFAFGPPSFEAFTVADFAAHASEVIGFDGSFEPERTVILCWTPREVVRKAVEPVVTRYDIPYVIHFEDNETHIAELYTRLMGADASTPVADYLTDLARAPAFVAAAAGATVIEAAGLGMLPRGMPSLWLEPGVDFDAFGEALRPHRAAALRRALGVPPESTLIVYPGNVHWANLEEVRELYRAVALLRQGGRDVRLIRTGENHVPAEQLRGGGPEDGTVELGHVDRAFLVQLLKLADIFVQPGKPGPFNDFRLPSKIPEFMAVGRPLILPATNVGTRLRDGVDAMLIAEGSAAEIAAKVEAVLADPGLARRLADNGRRFARRHYDWRRQGSRLAAFLDRVTERAAA